MSKLYLLSGTPHYNEIFVKILNRIHDKPYSYEIEITLIYQVTADKLYV
jgi:hypothetical protein